MKYNFKTRSLNYLIEGIGLRYIWDDNHRQFGIGIRFPNLGGLFLRPNSSDYFVSPLYEKVEDMSWREGSKGV